MCMSVKHSINIRYPTGIVNREIQKVIYNQKDGEKTVTLLNSARWIEYSICGWIEFWGE